MLYETSPDLEDWQLITRSELYKLIDTLTPDTIHLLNYGWYDKNGNLCQYESKDQWLNDGIDNLPGCVLWYIETKYHTDLFVRVEVAQS